MTAPATAPTGSRAAATRRRRRLSSTDVLTVVLLVVLLGRPLLTGLFDSPAMRTWATIFVAICVQALPFLVLGVLLSAAIAVFVPASAFPRILPRHPAAAVPVAGAAGLVLPGCECSSVPVARGLMGRGVPPAAALAFLLSAPAINPVVLVATAIAFPGRPEMVGAGFLASFGAAVVVGWIWARFGRAEWLARPRRPETGGLSRWDAFRVNARHDFVHAGGFLVVGGLTAATLNVVVPREILHAVAADARPGVPWSRLYERANELAGDRAGFMGAGDDRVSFVGHGLGLEVDEPPYLARGFDDETLEEGMVFALEPKFVVAGAGAVGCENSYAVTATGAERLTPTPEELIEV